MRAVVVSRFGGPEVLQIAQLPDPQPGAGEVRVRVAAATVNPTDVFFRTGGYGPSATTPRIPGMELAGTVDAVGPGSPWRTGDQVMAIVTPFGPHGGADAEQVVVPSDSVARAPTGATLAEAATLPMNGLTARRALDLLNLRPGQVLAVTGAAGAVGGYVIQLAKHDGLRVVADAKPEDEALVRSLGADVVVPRGEGFAKAVRSAVPEGVDGLVDAAVIGVAVAPAVRDGGAIAVVRTFDGEPGRGIVVHTVRVADYLHNHDALEELARLAAEGVLTLRVAATVPADDVAEAHRRLEAGGVRGRLVLTFDGG